MTKKHYYYYCSKPSLRVVAVRVLSVRPPTTIRHPSTTHNTQPLSTNHDWPSNRCHRKKSINSSVGGGSSPKEFTKLFYDHCCVLPNHIPRLSVLVHVTLCGLELCYIILMMVMVGNLRKVEGYYDRMLMTLKLISSVELRIAHLIWLLL